VFANKENKTVAVTPNVFSDEQVRREQILDGVLKSNNPFYNKEEKE
jgi:hypothetical protein